MPSPKPTLTASVSETEATAATSTKFSATDVDHVRPDLISPFQCEQHSASPTSNASPAAAAAAAANSTPEEDTLHVHGDSDTSRHSFLSVATQIELHDCALQPLDPEGLPMVRSITYNGAWYDADCSEGWVKKMALSWGSRLEKLCIILRQEQTAQHVLQILAEPAVHFACLQELYWYGPPSIDLLRIVKATAPGQLRVLLIDSRSFVELDRDLVTPVCLGLPNSWPDLEQLLHLLGAHVQSLHSLSLRGILGGTDREAQQLATFLPTVNSLQLLDLSWTLWNRSAMATLAARALPAICCVRTLKLWLRQLHSHEQQSVFTQLCSYTSLRHLAIHGCSVKLHVLPPELGNELHTLELSGMEDMAGWLGWAQAHCKSLQSLTLRGNGRTVTAAPLPQLLQSFPKLKALHLRYMPVHITERQSSSDFGSALQTLQIERVPKAQLTEKRLQPLLSLLQSCPKLRVCSLRRSHLFMQKGLAKLLQTLSSICPKLETLDLTRDMPLQLHTFGIAFPALAKLPALKRLELGNTGLDAAAVLAWVPESVARLGLRALTMTAGQHLLRTLPHLKYLSLRDVQCGEPQELLAYLLEHAGTLKHIHGSACNLSREQWHKLARAAEAQGGQLRIRRS